MDVRSPATLLIPLLFFAAAGAAAVRTAETHTDCGVAQTAFSFCVAYVAGMESRVPSKCCRGVQAVEELAVVTGDKPGMCRCLRKLLVSARVFGGTRAASLPEVCGVATRVVPTSVRDSCAW